MPECSVQNSALKREVLLIWDADGAASVGDWITVLWRSFRGGDAPKTVSIPKLVEAHADDLRARYLAWVYELGERRIRGRRLVDHLELRPAFSYWWMTLFAEKCNYAKSPQITDAIRLMAFENWAAGRSIESVVLVSANQPLAECMRLWCAKLGVAFKWRRIAGVTDSSSWRMRLYQFLPHSLQALMWLVRHLFQCWPLRGAGLQEWRETEGQVTFVSYLFNLVPDALMEGRFESRYWTHLPDDLQREDCKTNWLHLYVKDVLLPTAGKAAEVVRKFNKTGQGKQMHVTLDAFLDAKVVIRTLIDWGRMAWVGKRFHQTISSSPSTALDLWPLFAEDWRRSMSGSTAMHNALFFSLFESALNSLPKQRMGVYLQENQGWEFALIHAWKAAGHGRLIGSPHSSVRYWDLRYFFDPRSYRRTSDNDLPLPDQVALNGAAAKDAYLEGGYPEAALIDVEALRYQYLGNARVKLSSVSPPPSNSLRVLVLGDYFYINTQQQMDLLEKAVQFLPVGAIIIVKPHPNCAIKPADYPALKMEVTMEPVSKLLAECDVAYTSAVTSAAVDAYCAGVPVISVLDPNALNLSPLRGMKGVVYVTTPAELAAALGNDQQRECILAEHYFCLDDGLPRWRKLLGME